MQDENFWNKYNVVRYFYQEKVSFDADSIGEKDVSVYHLVRRYSEEDNACWDESQEVSMTVNCVLAKTEASVTGDYTAEGKKPELKIAEDSNVSDLLPNLTEEEENEVVLREIKLAKETIDTTPADRTDIIDECKARITVFEEFAPKMMDEAEITATIKEVLAGLGIDAPTAKDKGKIMKELMPKVKGKADGKLVNQILTSMMA